MALILVVDDESLVRDIVAEILFSEGHAVFQATSGNEALEMCRETTFDLVITDLSMPLMNGFDLISSLRRLRKDMPIIAISGVYTGDLLQAVKLLGAKAILGKPFGPDELVGVVDKILGKQAKPVKEPMERSTHICKKCGAETTYWTYKPEHVERIPSVNCPVCGAIVSELSGVKMVAHFKKKAGG